MTIECYNLPADRLPECALRGGTQHRSRWPRAGPKATATAALPAPLGGLPVYKL